MQKYQRCHENALENKCFQGAAVNLHVDKHLNGTFQDRHLVAQLTIAVANGRTN